MSADLYAILLLVPLPILAILMIGCRGAPKGRDWIYRIVVLISSAALYAVGTPIFADAPTPSTANFISFLCIPFAAFLVRNSWIAGITAAFFAVWGIFTFNMYDHVAGANLTDRSASYYAHKQSFPIRQFAEEFAISERGTTHEACFAEDLRRYDDRKLLGFFEWHPIREFRVVDRWHSPISGLRELQSRPARIWFKGGRLDQGVTAFEVVGSGAFRPGYWPPRTPLD